MDFQDLTVKDNDTVQDILEPQYLVAQNNDNDHDHNYNDRKQDSVEISISELEGIANNLKMKEEIERERTARINDESSRHSVKSSRSSNNSKEKTNGKRYSKQVKRENKDADIRRQKMDILYKISQINMTYKKNSVVSMDNTLDDIELELDRMTKDINNVKGIDVCKTMLMLSVQGLEMANNRFDPIGVDLHGWSESLAYSMQNKDYDEVLSELYQKYASDAKMMPELKLLLMLAGSAAMFAWTKRITKSADPTETFGKMFNAAPQATPSPRKEYTYDENQDSVVSSAKIDEPEESINLNEIIKQMNTQKKKGGRPVGSKNKKKNVILA